MRLFSPRVIFYSWCRVLNWQRDTNNIQLELWARLLGFTIVVTSGQTAVDCSGHYTGLLYCLFTKIVLKSFCSFLSFSYKSASVFVSQNTKRPKVCGHPKNVPICWAWKSGRKNCLAPKAHKIMYAYFWTWCEVKSKSSLNSPKSQIAKSFKRLYGSD